MDVSAALALAGEGFSRRKIARLLGVSRNTLRKYLTDGASPPPGGKLASYLESVATTLSARPQARAMDVYRELSGLGYSGSYDLVKRKVRALRREGETGKQAPVPGLRAVVDLGRVETSNGPCQLFTMVLAFSGRIYAELSLRTDLEAFLEWQARGFRYFTGVPAEIVYEKFRNRMLKGFVGAAETNLPLARFAQHYGFGVHSAEPAAPWSAGRLKRPLRMIETLFLKGYPLQSLEGANTALLGWLLGREAISAAAPGLPDNFARDQGALRPLPKTEFAPFRLRLQEKGHDFDGAARDPHSQPGHK